MFDQIVIKLYVVTLKDNSVSVCVTRCVILSLELDGTCAPLNLIRLHTMLV